MDGLLVPLESTEEELHTVQQLGREFESNPAVHPTDATLRKVKAA